jgi:hypothetical protein
MLRVPYAICLAAALALSGCATERSVLVADETLSALALRDGGLAVVGMTMVDEVEQIRPPLVAALEQTLGESRPDLPFRTAEAVRDSLGIPASRALLMAYQRKAKLDDATMVDLSARLPGIRFAIVGRVEKTSEHLPPPPRSGEIAYGGPIGSRTTSRDARVRLALYDLTRRRVVLEAIYASSSENSLPDSIARLPERRRAPPPGVDPGVAVNPLPGVPSLANALIEGFRAFAYDLPR